MSITIIFFLGLIVALVGVIPPGLLNMTAAKISLKEGAARGIMFSTGVSLVVFIQTYIAAIFARYLTNRPDVVEILQRVAFVIFVLITKVTTTTKTSISTILSIIYRICKMKAY